MCFKNLLTFSKFFSSQSIWIASSVLLFSEFATLLSKLKACIGLFWTKLKSDALILYFFYNNFLHLSIILSQSKYYVSCDVKLKKVSFTIFSSLVRSFNFPIPLSQLSDWSTGFWKISNLNWNQCGAKSQEFIGTERNAAIYRKGNEHFLQY